MHKQITFTSSNPKLSAHGSVAASGGSDGFNISGGGRVVADYKLPSGGNIAASVSGSGYVARDKGRTNKGAKVDDVDLTYTQGNTSVGASYAPQSKRVMVRLTKRF